MRKAVIWDLDGTLFDSYDVIVESIHLALLENNISLSLDEIRSHALQFSIKSLFHEMNECYGVPVDVLNRRYGEISRGKYLEIKPMQNALAVLAQLRSREVEQYVFTHRGKTTIPVLEHLGMKEYFIEILTSQSGFARKPDPHALNYLICKYKLDPAQTYYVGDRSLDMECAANGGIQGIFYSPRNSVTRACGAESFAVEDLLDILKII